MANLFEYSSYKDYLKAKLQESAGLKRGLQAKMARAANCQPSYLAQVLNTKVELTPDHAAGIAVFLGFGHLEFEYFLNLVHHSRASSQVLKDILLRKLNDLKSQNEILSLRVQDNSVQSNDAPALYYSSWAWMAAHIALSVDAYRTPQSLADRLNLTVQKTRDILEGLREFGLASERDGKWSMTGKSLHLSEASFMNEMSHRNWRQRALLDIESERSSSLHYSSVFSMSRRDAHGLRNILLGMVQTSRELIEPSPSEEIFCFLCDFFEV